VRLPQVIDWLASAAPQVLVLQETKTTDDKFPLAELQSTGHHIEFFGQKTYNGVALISKSRASDVVKNIPNFEDEQARVIAATVDGVRVIGAYFPNGQAPDSDKFQYKMKWLRALRTWVADELKTHPKLVLMGDFNIAPDDRDVFDPVAMAGQIHCTEEERDHFKALIALGLTDAFRLKHEEPKLYSWWDYRNLAFRKNQGFRIDIILVSDALVASVEDCIIDKAPRKNERPSDHTPVVVSLSPAPG
jgi:exodeoxyribonuclease III